MSLTSIAFVLLAAVSVPVYYLVPGKYRWLVLLSASLGFTLWGGVTALVYLLGVTAVTYVAGRLLGRLSAAVKTADKSRVPKCKRNKKLVVLVTVVLAVLLLGILKFDLLSIKGLFVPLGISFYLFQSLGYVIDCYRGTVKPETNVLKYALFVSFFPQITQGPISRYAELMPQLTAERSFDADHVKYGIQLMLWGYMKKLVIADRAAMPVTAIFAEPLQYGGVFTAFGVLMYCIQLYCDFSGGIDIVRGMAQVYGIDLPENFRRPIFAQSLTEFWRRWHITLGAWMKDYVFYSMALSKPILKLGSRTRKKFGGRVGKLIPTSVCTFTIYFIIGIWHGGGSQFIAFGLYNGILITASLLLEGQLVKLRKKFETIDKSAVMKWFRILRTSGIVFVGRYLTRSSGVITALGMLKRTVTSPCLYQLGDGTIFSFGLTLADYAVIAVGTVILLAAEWYQEKGGHIRADLEKRPAVVQYLAILVPLLVLIVFGLMRGDHIQAAFIYQQY